MKKDEPEIRVRVPEEVREWLRAAAAANRRSMSGELEFRLVQSMRADQSGRETGTTAAGQASQA